MTTCSPERKRGAGAARHLAWALLISVHAAAAHERPAAAIANALVVANEQRASIDVPASTSFAAAGQPDHRNLESTSVRLVGGANEYEGTVEIFHDGSWGTICDDDWDLADANVVCKELFGTDALEVKTDAFFGEGTGPIWMDEVACDGSESSLSTCTFYGTWDDEAQFTNEWGAHDCGHDEDAGVVCDAPSAPTPGPTPEPGEPTPRPVPAPSRKYSKTYRI